VADPDDELLFEGLKVLDVATWIAGPVAATILADLGAEVIKIEQPGVGDAYRQFANLPSTPNAPANYCWLTDARNKRSLSLNLRDPEAKEILLRLVREADVYITNQPLPMRRAFGLTYEDLAPLNERLIYASLTAYGEDGPDALKEGFDGVAWWTRSALADLVRAPGAVPGGSVPGMGDHPTAVSLYAAIVTALLRRERTGKGGHVRTNLLHNGVWSNACLASAAFVDGVDFSPMKAPRPPIVSRQLYETWDGRLLQLYMVRTQPEIDALLIAAEATEILNDDRFSTFEAQQQHAAEFIAALRTLFKQRPAGEWLQLFNAAGVPVTHVAELTDLTDDVQLQAVGVVAPPADPAVGARFVINHPVMVDGLPRVGALPAPACGEHTDVILAELGLTPEQIGELHARGAV
jgi:crotonobetainyl-CoA:carnitine CoA-transferase CaiB-like acyl-CoA transferase